MSTNIVGTAVIALKFDATTLEKSSNEVASSTSKALEGAIPKTNAAASKWTVAAGNIITKGFEKTMGGVKDIVTTGMNFDSAMSQVAATLGTTTDQIGELRNFARKMGSETAFSASEAANALNYMALAGYDADKSMEMLPSVLNLAAAGSIDLASASDMVTDAQSALSLSMGQTESLVNQMAKASSKSHTSVAQLGEAILTVGGTATYMAGGTEELTTVLGVLADNSIKGAEGGTHLRNMLLSLASPSKDAAKLLKNLKVNIYDAQGNMRSFSDIFPELNKAMSKFTDQQKVDAFATLFNTRDIASATALLNTSKERWDELGASIENAGDAAKEMADTQLDNLGGDKTKMQAAMDDAKIAISEALMPVLRTATQALSGVFKWMSKNSELVIKAVMGIGGAIVIAFTGKKIISAIQTLRSVVNGVIGVFQKFKKSPKIVSDSFNGIQRSTKAFGDGLASIFNGIGNILTSAVNMIVEPVKALLQGAAEAISGFIKSFASPEVLLGSVGFAAAAASIASAIFLIGSAVGATLPAMTDLFNNVIVPLTGLLVGSVLNIINTVTEAVVNLTQSAIIPLTEVLAGAFSTVLNSVSGLITAVGNVITNILGTALEGISKIISSVGEAFEHMGVVIRMALDGVSGVLNAFAGILETIGNAIIAVVSLATGRSVFYGSGFSRVAKTAAQGGRVNGPGTSTSDSIPYMLSDGEYVIRAAAAESIGYGTLDALNAYGRMGALSSDIDLDDDIIESRDSVIVTMYNNINNNLDAEDIGRKMAESIRRAA